MSFCDPRPLSASRPARRGVDACEEALYVEPVLIRYASHHSDPVAVTAWHMLGGPLLLIAEILGALLQTAS